MRTALLRQACECCVDLGFAAGFKDADIDTGARIGTFTSWEERIATVRAHGLGALAAPSMERWFSENFRRRQGDEVRGYASMLLRTSVEGYVGTCSALRDADLKTKVNMIRKPTLVLCGDQDIATPPELARELAGSIPGARLSILEQAAHLLCVEQPGAMTKQIMQFFREVQIV